MINKKMVLIGGGNMGTALLRGILKAGLTARENMTVVDVQKSKLEALNKDYGVPVTTQSSDAVKGADVVILAVKPGILHDAIDGFRDVVTPEQLFISIIAGVESTHIRDRIGKGNPVIRAMPNIAATVEASASAIAGCPPTSEDQLRFAEEIFGAVGEVVRVDEEHLDAVTGLSGSGPAYIYMVIEALCDGGVKMGLARDVAMKLAIQTVFGASKLVKDTGQHPTTLKDQVTTPGGTTIAAVHELEERGLRATLISAVATATERSKALNAIAKAK